MLQAASPKALPASSGTTLSTRAVTSSLPSATRISASNPVIDLVTDESRLAEMRAHVGHIELSSTLDLMFDDIESLANGARDLPTASPWGATA